ncbi:MAG: thiamine pyrophosphate-binding protein [Thermoproteota archaeon]
MPRGTVASFVADVVERVGTGRIYGVIGTSVVDFVDELYGRRDRVRYITTRHEQVAVSMADAESRVSSGRVGAAVVHAGPGFLNAAISLGIAKKDRSPLLLISGGVRRRLYGTDAWLEIDQSLVSAAVAKSYARLRKAEDVVEALPRILRDARTTPAGPAVLEVPEDLWNAGIEYSSSDIDAAAKPPKPGFPGVEDVRAILEAFEKSEKPVILVSGEAAAWGSAGLYDKLAELLGAYVVVSGNGRGACSEDNPRCLGRAGFGGGALPADAALEEADLILALGPELDDITTYGYVLRPSGDVIIVSEDPAVEKRPVYYTMHVKANPLETAKALLEVASARGKRGERPDWDRRIAELRAKWASLLDEASSRRYSGVANPNKFFRLLNELLPRRRIVAAGQGTHVLYAYDYLKVFEPRTFLAATNLGAMGFALPAAMAAKLTHPDYEVVAVLGDGELMMVVQDLETVAREKIAVKIVVVNDYSYRVLLLRQKLQKQGRVYGTVYTNPDFAELAETFGIRGIRVTSDAEAEQVAEELVESDGPLLIDLVVSQEDLPPLNLDYTLKMSV